VRLERPVVGEQHDRSLLQPGVGGLQQTGLDLPGDQRLHRGGLPTYREICDQVAAKGYAGMIIA
jgi:hypothetical protein